MGTGADDVDFAEGTIASEDLKKKQKNYLQYMRVYIIDTILGEFLKTVLKFERTSNDYSSFQRSVF